VRIIIYIRKKYQFKAIHLFFKSRADGFNLNLTQQEQNRLHIFLLILKVNLELKIIEISSDT
jgi:hypothetical protein